MRPLQSPTAPELAFLSFHEFLRFWRVEPPAYVFSEDDMNEEWESSSQATLTAAGVEKAKR
eukprot:1273439-Karenia_brevis.AAC.1